jgi:hypothetical protein
MRGICISGTGKNITTSEEKVKVIGTVARVGFLGI